ncbi:hypothetical protein ACH4D5_36410 [Streptomyces sp. NPDC018029]|uniref:hypothetical protein n=1 Tax=Streptomyces sp. NPDC018029 TaxID=3365032 RepID=UPI0037AC0565
MSSEQETQFPNDMPLVQMERAEDSAEDTVEYAAADGTEEGLTYAVGPPPFVPFATGYQVPDFAAVKGIPQGAKWRDVDPQVAMVRTGNAFQLAKNAAPQYFNDAAFNRQVWAHEAHAKKTDHWFENELLHHLDEFVDLVGTDRCMFVGEADLDFPWLRSTDSVQGPASLSYTVSHTVTQTKSTTSGWSAGGSLGITLGKDPVKVSGTATFQYSYSTTNTTSWADGDSTSSTHQIPAGKSGRIDIYSLAGRYHGFFYISLLGIRGVRGGPGHGIQWRGRRMVLPFDLIAIPMVQVMVKIPDCPSPLWRQLRLWDDGQPAPRQTQ